jgi:hypothetical protein
LSGASPARAGSNAGTNTRHPHIHPFSL